MTTHDGPTPEKRESFTDAAALIEQYEAIGDDFYADWEAHIPFNNRFGHSGRINEPFTLASGATGEFGWLQDPTYSRKGLPELGKRWLPSGGFHVTEVIDGEEILTSYNLGRRLSANTHQSDTAIVIQSRYRVVSGEGQKLLGDTLLSTQDEDLKKCADFLSEIKIILENKDWNPEPVAEEEPDPAPVEAAQTLTDVSQPLRMARRILGRR